MRARLQYWMRWLREGLGQVAKDHPVELVLTVYGCAGCFLGYEMQWPENWTARLALVPMFALLALIVNNLAGRGPWRKLYWVCWTPIVPLSLWGGLAVWLETLPGIVTGLVLLPLGVLVCRRAVCNTHFVCDAMIWIRSAVLALLFANVTLGLFCATFFSTVYIFGLEGAWTERVAVYAVILCNALAAPVLFMMISDRWHGVECTGSRILDILLNYIVTPALLIYTAVLGLYLLKIVVLWSLPRGGVAYLVFGFTIVALGVKAMQALLQKRLYDWFFDRFSLLSLPLQVLFWVGVMQRTNEYGLTEPRVWLVVCGALMTLCVLLFLARRTGHYLYLCLVAMVVFAAVAYVPLLNPERIALRSQTHRAVELAERLGVRAADGKWRLEALPTVDTAQHYDLRKLYESLEYIERRDSAAFAALGLGMTNLALFESSLPDAVYDYVVNGKENRMDKNGVETIRLALGQNHRVDDLARFGTLYLDVNGWDDQAPVYCRYERDTLRLRLGEGRPLVAIPGDVLLPAPLREGVLTGRIPSGRELRNDSDRLLAVDCDSMLLLFSNMTLHRTDSTLNVDDVSLHAIFLR